MTCPFSSQISHLLCLHGYLLPLLQCHIFHTLLQCQIFYTPPSIQLSTNCNLSATLITTYYPGFHILKCTLRESHHILLSNLSTCKFLSHLSTVTSAILLTLSFLVRTSLDPRPPCPGSYLTWTNCVAIYIGETRNNLFIKMNIHQSSTKIPKTYLFWL